MTRLLNALLELACCSGDREDPLATIPLLARELAVLAGLSRETTSRTLSKLREKGQLESTHDEGMRLLTAEPLEKRCLL